MAPTPDTLPTEFAVFPLAGALLLPGGKLPLNIFEPRYVAMIEDALRGDRVIGMMQPDPQALPGPCGEGLYRTGCAGRVSSFTETEDGRFLISLNGLARFWVVSELEQRRGYRRVRAEYRWQAVDLAEGVPIGLPRGRLRAALADFFAAQDVDANWGAIDAMPDAALVTTLCMACPFEPAEKQALLEAPDQAARASALLTLLRMGAASSLAAPAGRPS